MLIKFLAICFAFSLSLTFPLGADAKKGKISKKIFVPAAVFLASVAENPYSLKDDQANTLIAGATLVNGDNSFSFKSRYLTDFINQENVYLANSLMLLGIVPNISTGFKAHLERYTYSSVSKSVDVAPAPATNNLMFAGLILMVFFARRRTN